MRLELPPRARRIRLQRYLDVADSGTTSACAENTIDNPNVVKGKRNYLRVRGEYKSYNDAIAKSVGTTSACAENTGHSVKGFQASRNYLRVRGEYHIDTIVPNSHTELPPRAR